MADGFVQTVGAFLAEAVGERPYKVEVYEAAKAVDGAEGRLGDILRSAFWSWLTSGRWLQREDYGPMAGLADASPLDADEIRSRHVPDFGRRFDFVKAEAAALDAYNRRQRRALEYARAGWPEERWRVFVYSKPEFREVREKLRKEAA